MTVGTHPPTSLGTRPRAIAAVARLRQVLEQSAAGLAVGSLDDLLTGEAALAHALADLSRPPSDLTADDRRHLRTELDAARDALTRCRVLGESLTDYVRLTLDAQGRATGYDPQRTTAVALGGRGLNARV
jgi:hypothetical protein